MSQLDFDDEPLWRRFADARTKEGNLNDHLDLPSVFESIRPGNGSIARSRLWAWPILFPIS
jgi:hypothetical protein